MKIHVACLLSFVTKVSAAWVPNSWRQKRCAQLPKYRNKNELTKVEEILSRKPPLVISPEIDNLKKELIQVENGERFLFMGGDCAETFREHSSKNIINNYQLFILSTIILMTKTGKKITKIARAAGQFSKPRTNDFEVVNGLEVPAYKGDMINRENIEQREPDPHLMIRAYNQCSETLNLLRALSSSHKYSNINIFNWKTEFQSNIYRMNLLGEILNKIQSSVNVLSSSELDESRSINSAQIYTGHEGMLLNYEESLTRKDRFTDKYYDCSSHFLWIGERTRQLDCGHVEFFRGIHNPIGIKISHKVKPWELVNLIFILNPQNERGKICLITRMGSHIEDYLPELIDIITKYGLNVIWVCDPMHGNGKNVNGIKTRYYNDIKKEVDAFFMIHYDKGTIPGGIHLEMTGNDVTECLGGSYMMDVQNETFLRKNYLSSCDPRLNFFQTIELIDHISNIIV
tara:strand:- start:4725 stop:6098 length:1374 start_codon:yes stop_codon:yes gene_type:complete